MRAAKHVSVVLAFPADYVAVCSAAQFQSFAQHLAHAAELMQLPRRHSGEVRLPAEVAFTQKLRDLVSATAANGLDARLVQLLTAAWQRLQRSGGLEARCIGEEDESSTESKAQARAAAILTSVNAPGLRSCALAGCGAREAHPQHFKSCAACRAVAYCSKEHQVEGWPAHKKACKAARTAAAVEEDAAEGGPSSA